MLSWDEMIDEQRNVLIAEKVMGWKIKTYADLPDIEPEPDWVSSDAVICTVGEFTPSTDMSNALEVLDRFNNWQITKFGDTYGRHGQYRVFIEANQNIAFADSAPEAVCLAALKAVGVDVGR